MGLCPITFVMAETTLSIFVDESGSYAFPDRDSRFYIVGLVFHNQCDSITSLSQQLDQDLHSLGMTNLCFHAGPIIRHEKGYEYMNWQLRNRIFSRMMAFARRVKFRYHCLFVDKNYVASLDQISRQLERDFNAFLDQASAMTDTCDRLKVYYDYGQSPVTNLLEKTLSSRFTSRIEFATNVKPYRYKLFQIADLVCTLTLIEHKLETGLPMTRSEMRFFGGPRDFKRNILKKIKAKEI